MWARFFSGHDDGRKYVGVGRTTSERFETLALVVVGLRGSPRCCCAGGWIMRLNRRWCAAKRLRLGFGWRWWASSRSMCLVLNRAPGWFGGDGIGLGLGGFAIFGRVWRTLCFNGSALEAECLLRWLARLRWLWALVASAAPAGGQRRVRGRWSAFRGVSFPFTSLNKTKVVSFLRHNVGPRRKQRCAYTRKLRRNSFLNRRYVSRTVRPGDAAYDVRRIVKWKGPVERSNCSFGRE